MVLAPESELVAQLTTSEQREEVEAYLAYVAKRTERDRMADHKVTGVFSGSYGVNPFTGERIPIWISEYVLAGYGTGAIMPSRPTTHATTPSLATSSCPSSRSSREPTSARRVSTPRRARS